MADAEANPAMDEEGRPDARTIQVLQDMANRLRIYSIRASCALRFGHPTSCSSGAEIMSVLFFYVMRYKQADPENPNNDRFILSRRLSFIDVAVGWFGQGLGAACGVAYTGKYFDKASYRVYCFVRDSESLEGSVWEALAFASHYSLDNLVAIFDVNRVGHSAMLPLEHCIDIYKKRCEAFGWNTYIVDGRDVEALCQVFWQAAQVKNRPTAIVAKTFKGRTTPTVEDAETWHGKPMPSERADAIVKLIESQIETTEILEPHPPIEDSPQINITGIEMASPPAYKFGDRVATHKACSLALAKLGHANDRVVVLDSESRSSACSEIFKNEHPERFIECFIAEQNMVNVAMGCAHRGRTVAFAGTFATFSTRAFDQIRMGAMSRASINLIGSHCGISSGEDSPSQMALEDLAMFRAIPNCTIFYPSDAVSAEYAVFLAANTKGICYIRTSDQETAVIYNPQENFVIGQAKVILQSVSDEVTVIGAGVTLREILVAAEALFQEGICIRVIDLFTVKPLDAATIISSAKCTGGRILTVEDHHPEGGIGEAVSAAVSMEPDILLYQMSVPGMPRCGQLDDLLDVVGISARHIAATVKCIMMN